jgi:hypothetical protein
VAASAVSLFTRARPARYLGQINGTPVFRLGFDENRVNGIQPRRAGAPPPMACTVID